MDKAQQIRNALQQWAAKHGPDASVLGTVKSVDDDAMTCSMEVDEGIEFEVRLRPVLDGTESITLFPKVGSMALAIRIEADEDWYLLHAGEVDKWQLKIGTTIIEQDADGLLIKKDADTLKQVFTNIIEAVQQVVVMYGNNPDYTKLIEAQTKVNNLFK